MAIRIRQLDDVEEARRLHALGFPHDEWVGDDHTFWVAYEDDRVVGFASAILWQDLGVIFLSRCAVVKAARGSGLQRRLIRVRLRWGKAEGAAGAWTYTTLKNYGSMVNLLKCGFKFCPPSRAKYPIYGKTVHTYLYEFVE